MVILGRVLACTRLPVRATVSVPPSTISTSVIPGVMRILPEPRHASPDGHLRAIKDFADLVTKIDAEVEDAVAVNARGRRMGLKRSIRLENLFGEKAVFGLKRR